jgi:hypothetical protein
MRFSEASQTGLIRGVMGGAAGEGSDNAFIVPLKEGVSPFEGKRRTHVEGGAVFFIVVICGLLIVRRLYEAQR